MLLLRKEALNGSLREAHNNRTILMSTKQPVSLASLSRDFSTEQSCGLWAAIQASSHTDLAEQKAVARAIVKDLLSANASRYLNAFYAQLEALYPYRLYAAYNLTLCRDMPKFAQRASKKREKTVLGWIYLFLTAAGEAELLAAFETAISDQLPK